MTVHVCKSWCSEIGSRTSLNAPELRASSDVKEPISLHQAVHVMYRLEVFFFLWNSGRVDQVLYTRSDLLTAVPEACLEVGEAAAAVCCTRAA